MRDHILQAAMNTYYDADGVEMESDSIEVFELGTSDYGNPEDGEE